MGFHLDTNYTSCFGKSLVTECRLYCFIMCIMFIIITLIYVGKNMKCKRSVSLIPLCVPYKVPSDICF